jgi:hypothetical protein
MDLLTADLLDGMCTLVPVARISHSSIHMQIECLLHTWLLERVVVHMVRQDARDGRHTWSAVRKCR